jgi:outer membrane protein assembly factor BamA
MARLEDADPGSLLTNEPWSQLKDSESPSLNTKGRWTDAISFVVVREGFDNPLEPSKGIYLKAMAELSPSIVSKQLRVPYVKVEASFDAYIPLGRITLRLNGSGAHARVIPMGQIQTYQAIRDGEQVELQPAIPLESRYRLGGTSSLRGFRRGAVGPLNQVEHLDFDWSDNLDPAIDLGLASEPYRWVPTGGDTKFLGTAELLIPFTAMGMNSWDGYWLIAFADVGNTWLTGKDAYASSMSAETKGIFNPVLRYGVGFGLRVDTPVGPIQGDLGFNPERLFGSAEKRSLLRDKWKEPGARLHLSFGTLF